MTVNRNARRHTTLPDAAELVVAGGGVAGSAAASLLAQAGREVLLLERETHPTDKICGEFLSTETQVYLRRIGLDLDTLGGHTTTHLRLVRNRKVVETRLPFSGLGLSRRRLDEALLNHASHCGAHVCRGQRVCRTGNLAPTELCLQDGGKVLANTLFLATGKQELRGLRRVTKTVPEDLVGFKMHFDVGAAQRRELESSVELILFAHGYAGLQRIEDGKVNLCLLTQRKWLLECGGHWEELLRELLRTCPHLHQRLQDAIPLMPLPLSIYRVPYGFVHQPAANDPDGVYRLGDQAGVISSFSGDGMGIALHSAFLATNSYLAGSGSAGYHRQFHRDIAGQLKRADWLYQIGRRGISQHLLLALTRLCPSLLEMAASLTRVPPDAVIRNLTREHPDTVTRNLPG